MLCEFILFYGGVYLLVHSIKSCFVSSDDEEVDLERMRFLKVESMCPAQAYHTLERPDLGGSECSICFEPYRPETTVRKMPCDHFICEPCFYEWIQCPALGFKCPLCNQGCLTSSSSSPDAPFISPFEPLAAYDFPSSSSSRY